MKYNFISREGGTGEALKHVLHLVLGHITYYNSKNREDIRNLRLV